MFRSLFAFIDLLQDYHRFHSPVSGVIEKFVNVSGSLYTVLHLPFHVEEHSSLPLFSYWSYFCILGSQVNPIAVNSKYCNVFTENKRTIVIISTAEFGKVCHLV